MSMYLLNTVLNKSRNKPAGKDENMASIEFLTKRVEGKKAELKKLTAKMERIEKAQATNWEVNPYYYHESDLRSTAKQIAQAEQALADYTAKLEAEQEKANNRNVKAIIEFLENWKQSMREFFAGEFAEYPAAYEQHHKDIDKLHEAMQEERRTNGAYNWKEWREAEHKIHAQFSERWGHMFAYVDSIHDWKTGTYTFKFDTAKFEQEIKREAERKYDDIILRTQAVVGEITDASALKVGYKGNLDGIIIGTKGKAKVQTIGAGGYNIQCFHFRTLIHEL